VQIGENTRVTIDYTLRLDSGETVDTSEGRMPLVFDFGQGQILPGLERELTGLEIGMQKEIRVESEEGYGPRQEEAVMEIPLDRFPEDISPSVGLELMVRGPKGEEMPLTVVGVSDGAATVDFNHPLAGEALNFFVTIRDVAATGTRRIILPGEA
jgi:FKBP-type peptidyl-prolyl cis-trans isomerase 2